MSHQPLIFAHRGARRVAPENTLPAFAAALDQGADGIELDVHRTRDGALVVIHDFVLERTTDGHGPVRGATLDEIRRLDAGSRFAARFAGTQVPTLDEVLDLVGDRCLVNIEIKSDDPYGCDASDGVLATIRRRKLYDRVIVSSFNPVTLIKLRHLDADLALGVLYEAATPEFLRELWAGPLVRPQAQHPSYDMVDEGFMAWARGHGCAVNVWTVNELPEARRLANLGVDALITDVPDLLLAGGIGAGRAGGVRHHA